MTWYKWEDTDPLMNGSPTTLGTHRFLNVDGQVVVTVRLFPSGLPPATAVRKLSDDIRCSPVFPHGYVRANTKQDAVDKLNELSVCPLPRTRHPEFDAPTKFVLYNPGFGASQFNQLDQ